MSKVSRVSRSWVVGLGGNLGDRRAYLHAAIYHLAGHPDIVLEAIAPLYETPGMGPPQPDYLNTAVRIRTTLQPQLLLAYALEVERSLGRERGARWGPRTIDIDLLDWSGPAIDEEGLSVPHPGLRERPFTWFPYQDVTWRQDAVAPPTLVRPPRHSVVPPDVADLVQALETTPFVQGLVSGSKIFESDTSCGKIGS